MTVAIIPARGGSKRLPRKNILPLAGRPLLSYPVGTARNSGLFEEVIVSTEDEEIAAVARGAGATVQARPEGLAADRATVVEVCLNVLDSLAAQGREPAAFCCLYATAAFLDPADLTASLALLEEADFVIGVSVYETHPYQALKEEGGFLTPMWPEYEPLQSQFYPKAVASNGTLYWARTAPFRERRSFYGSRLRGYEVPRDRAVDIDTPEDYARAQRLAAR